MKHSILYTISFVVLAMFPLDKVLGQQMKVFSNLEIGDTIPDINIEKIHNYNKTASKVSEFSEKLLIIDFWATWCSPCIQMLPKMDSLMQDFSNELVFLSVTKESKEKAQTFLEKLEQNRGSRFNIPVIYSDTLLNKMFPHYYLPHYVWINTLNREVIAITRADEINRRNIENVLGNSKADGLRVKVDQWLDYDYKAPLLPFLLGTDLPEAISPKQYSCFWKFIPNLKGAEYVEYDDSFKPIRLVSKNASRLSIIKKAFGEGRKFFQDKSIVIQVKYPNKLTTYPPYELRI